MADIVDSKTRSRMMSGIRSRNTKPEMKIRKILHKNGFRFRLHVRELPGKPDIVLPRYRAVIFVHGCFWHGHDCHVFRIPSTNTEFWKNKIERNRKNDCVSCGKLLESGWRICVVWECATRIADGTEIIAQRLSDWLRNGDEKMVEIR